MKIKAFKLFSKMIHIAFYTAQTTDDAKEAGVTVDDDNNRYVWFYKLPHLDKTDNDICRVYNFKWLKYGIKIMILDT